MKCEFCGGISQIGSEKCAYCGNTLNIHNDNTNINNNINVTNGVTNNENVNNVEKKKGKILPIIIILIVVILFIIALIFILIPSPLRIFKGTINNIYSKTDKTLTSNYDSSCMSISIKPNISSSESLGGAEKIFNNLDFKLEGALDYKNKKFLYNFISNYDNNELLNIDVQYDNNLYLILNNLYSKPINVGNTNFNDAFEKSDTESIKKLFKGFKDAFNSSIKGSYFKSSKETINVNGKSVNSKVSTLVLNKENAKELINNMKTKLLKDDEFIKAFAKINDMDSNKANESINDLKIEDDFKEINISLYTTGFSNAVVKLLIKDENSSFEVLLKDDNDLLVNVSNKNMSLSFDINYDIKYNNNVNLKDVKSAVSVDNISYDLFTILNKFTNTSAFNKLNSDIKDLTGISIDEYISSMLYGNNSNIKLGSSYDY